MKNGLILLFVGILLGMIGITTYASLDRAIWNVRPELLSDPWFHATLLDTYFGFLTFYLWVAYKESSWLMRIIWFILIMTLGNIAMAIYALIQLVFWNQQDGAAGLLLHQDHAKRLSSENSA